MSKGVPYWMKTHTNYIKKKNENISAFWRGNKIVCFGQLNEKSYEIEMSWLSDMDRYLRNNGGHPMERRVYSSKYVYKE